MIFHDHRAIFFHIGKTAGTSIEEMLMPGHKMDPHVSNRALMFGFDKPLNIYLHHASCTATRDLTDKDIFDSYFKFAVVRNPFTRMISTYFYLHDFHLKKYGAFRDFVLALPSLAAYTPHLRGSHYISQTHYTHIGDQQVVDYIGRFESLDTVVSTLNEKLGINTALPRVNIRQNQNRPKSAKDLYDDETADIIRDVYRDDFKTFGYETDLPT